MAVHLTRIYTRTGDDGTTGSATLAGIEDDARLTTYADCDETNAALGAAVALGAPGEEVLEVLRRFRTTCSTRARTWPPRLWRNPGFRRCGSPRTI